MEISDNLFVDVDSGIFLNAFFLNVDPTQGRVDPNLTITRNVFTGVRSYATAFPDRTGHVITGSSPATITYNHIVGSDRLMEREPAPGPWELAIEHNHIYGPLELAPRDRTRLEADGNVFHAISETETKVLAIPWVGRTLRYLAPK